MATYVRLASLLRRHGDQIVADAGDGKSHKDADGVMRYATPQDVMEDMVRASDPPSAEALLARSRYLREVGLFSDAVPGRGRRPGEVAPEEVEVLLASAD